MKQDFVQRLKSCIEKLDCKSVLLISKDDHDLKCILDMGIDIEVKRILKVQEDSLQKYDYIIETEDKKYVRMKKMLAAMDNKYNEKYFVLSDLEFLIHFSQGYRRLKKEGVKFYFFEIPSIDDLRCLNEKDIERYVSNKKVPFYFENKGIYHKELSEFFGTDSYDDQIEMILDMPEAVNMGDSLCYEEFRSKHMNVSAGVRVTANKINNDYKRQINLFGQCTAFGYMVKDEDTIPSLLQQFVNESAYSYYGVNNYGFHGATVIQILKSLAQGCYQKEDVIAFFLMKEDYWPFLKIEPEIKIVKTTDDFNFSPMKTWFIDNPFHCNADANKIIAKSMLSEMSKDMKDNDCVSRQDEEARIQISKKEEYFREDENLKDYLNDLKLFSGEIAKRKYKRIGMIGMNCNPFTLGHRYLVEYAASHVDLLYILVVHEDKSFFKFNDRFRLVYEGTKDIDNVILLHTGEVIASTKTFDDYFKKDKKQNVKLDFALDIAIFVQHLAPTLNINVRFVGEEPVDMVTSQYNQQLKSTLPLYGVELVEIPRKKLDNDSVISASTVRKLMSENRWEEIKLAVPKTTYDFLEKENKNCDLYFEIEVLR